MTKEDYMAGCLKRLSETYRAIDESYAEVQAHYEFSCKGCPDNCCATKFHHHTLIEELYLAEGLKILGESKTGDIIARAANVAKTHESSSEDVRVMCPVNDGGRCIVYEHRPMICRIHGVPYELFRNMRMEYGDGCYRFIEGKAGIEKSFRLKRTGFYFDIAMLEKELREQRNFTGRYKKTTAEMILSIAGEKK